MVSGALLPRFVKMIPNTFQVLSIVFLIHNIQDANCFLPLLPLGYVGGIAGIYAGYSALKCKFVECCIDEYDPSVIMQLDSLLTRELYGQKIAHETVLKAIRGHLFNSNPEKPLSMSFHGLPGSGKNFVAKMIAMVLFKKGESSKYYHFFHGRDEFPLDSDVEIYKVDLRKTVIESLKKCERSLFVFDEVHQMPAGVLNSLVSILDYTSHSVSPGINKNKAIFIFLSNTANKAIVDQMLKLWMNGKRREDTKLQDFENLITKRAFNENGGFYRSHAIESSLIDHYVPFLPLEQSHVINCIKRAFRKEHVEPTKEMIDEVLSHLTFSPPPHNLYSTSGCKRIDRKVALLVNDTLF